MSRAIAACSDSDDSCDLTLEEISALFKKEQKRMEGWTPVEMTLSIDSQIKSWLQELQNKYHFYNTRFQTQEQFNYYFQDSQNPYLLALKLFIGSSINYENCKTNSFTYFVMQALQNYVGTHVVNSSQCLDPYVKKLAFVHTKSNPNSHIFNLVSPLYELHKNPEIFLPFIKSLAEEHNYSLACKLSEKLKIEDPSIIDLFLMPMAFIENNLQELTTYLKVVEPIQAPYLQKLDSLLKHEETPELCKIMVEKYNYKKIPTSNFTYVYIKQRIQGFRKKFKNIPLDVTPNLEGHMKRSAVRWIVNEFISGEMTELVFSDNVIDRIKADDVDLQKMLINDLVSSGHSTEGLKWMKHFKYEMKDFSIEFQQCVVKTCDNEKTVFQAGGRKAENNHYILDPRIVEIEVIDKVETFRKMIDVLKSEEYITFDCESKTDSVFLAILQIACKNRVYIVDAEADCLTDDEWAKLGAILKNHEMLKIGFGLHNDLAMLQNKLKFENAKKTSSFLDIQTFWQYLRGRPFYKSIVPKNSKYDVLQIKNALKDLVKVFLNKELDKKCRFSNWSHRPLRPEQIHYAAADAYCLVEVFDLIKHNLKTETNLDINDVIANYQAKS